MHTYSVDETNTLHIFVNKKEVFAHGPFETAKEADAWAKNICDLYNDITWNPNKVAFPKDPNEE